MLGAGVEPADCPERKSARHLLANALVGHPELEKLWVDGGFNDPEFAAWVKTQQPKLAAEVLKRLADVPGFTLLPKRWVVERTFGWLMHCRRLVRDHEQTTAPAAAWIYLAMPRLMLRRLACTLPAFPFSDRLLDNGWLPVWKVGKIFTPGRPR